MTWLLGIVTAAAKGLVEPLLAWWSAYRQGRNAQRVADLEADLAEHQRIADAVAEVRRQHQPVRVDPDGRVRGAANTAAGVPPVPGTDAR